MLRCLTTLALSLTAISCGIQEKSRLQDVGSDIDPAKRTLEVMVGFKNTELLDRQFRLLSRASGLSETLSLELYGAINLEGEYLEFLSTPGLKYGDIVREGSVFVLSTVYAGDQLEYKIGEGMPKSFEGHGFEQAEKDGVLMALSGHPNTSGSVTDTPDQKPEGGEAKKLIFLCKDMRIKQLYTEEWREMGCDLNVVNSKLQISYMKTAANPAGVTFSFEAPAVL